MTSFGVFFVAMLEEFHWSRSVTAGVFSTGQFAYGLFAPLTGLLLDRFGPRVVVPVGACVLAAGLVAVSLIDSIWQFYVFYGLVVAFGLNSIGAMMASTVVQRWFTRLRGTAIGISGSGMGVGLVVVVPAAQFLVSAVGWRGAYQILAGATVLVIVPLTTIFLRRSPQSMGLAPDGVVLTGGGGMRRKVEVDRVVVDRDWASCQWDRRSAIRTRRFWLLGASLLAGPLGVHMILVHQIAFLTESGLDKMAAATALGMIGLVTVVGRASWGYVSDRIGREHAFLIASSAALLGVIGLLAGSSLHAGWSIWAYTLLFGAGYSAMATIYAAACADVFQGPSFGAIYGMLYIFMGVGGGFGPWFAGYTYDSTGSYYLAFSIGAVAMMASGVLMWLAGPRKVRTVAGKLRAPAG